MTTNKKITGKIVGRTALTVILATLVFTCDKIPEYCGDGYTPLNSATEFCFGGAKYSKCGGKTYSPGNQKCEDETGILLTQCLGGKDYHNPVTHFCDNGEMHRRCGGKAYNTSTELCTDNNEIHIPCDGGKTVPAGSICDEYCLTTTAIPSEGGSITRNPDSECYAPQTPVTVTAVVESGYKFSGWSGAENSSSSAFVVTMNGTMALIANFERTYTLTVNSNPADGGITTPASSLPNITAGAPVSISAFPASGYAFSNWSIDRNEGKISDPTAASTSVIVNGDATVTANFKQQYTVTYNGNGGNGIPPSPQYVDAGKNVTLASGNGLTRGGYVFDGWNTNTSGTGINYSAGEPFMPTASITLYAKWIAGSGVQYTVTYDINGGSGNVPQTQYFEPGSSVTFASACEFTRSGYSFGGWNDQSSGMGNNYSAGASVLPTGNMYLYAKWNAASTLATPEIFTDARDGKTYRKVKIGTQTWMAENLNYETSGSVCYDKREPNCSTYGRLYSWSAVMNGASSSSASPSGVQGICPAGWHVPSSAEWTTLINTIGDALTAAIMLCATSGWGDCNGGTDDYGFSALPGGYCFSSGYCSSMGEYARWWSATEDDAQNAWQWNLSYVYSAYISRLHMNNTNLLSLRCISN
ncbi:MAG: InlB B-repeat-containing protein [Chitinispirillia bacterium]|nr:InlB B-repeat-containing protein [Chitinispirillia bacterium]MCL2242589.1 InlB B-repeat-containing protein [Chitinispirillia bacterium]